MINDKFFTFPSEKLIPPFLVLLKLYHVVETKTELRPESSAADKWVLGPVVNHITQHKFV